MLSSDSPAPGGAADISASAAAASPHPFPSLHITTTTTTTTTTAATKRKRRPAGTPDPDAEVVSLSPRTLLESDRYVCEICNQGFQRDQNLQMHRRRHKVPWKLLKREGGAGGEGAGAEARKRVFVCPEPSCLHHDPCHALGDLVGIKKHFRRKHSTHRQWVCAKCSKAYAVQSDYKAHLKTCGTRGHSCDCGRVFSRVESFIEHQDQCTAGRAGARADLPSAATAVQLANARRIRHQAQVELSRAIALRDHAVKQINATLLQITCCSCKSRFRAKVASCRPDDDNSLAASYVSSAVTGGEDAKNREHNNKVAKMAAT
ncbi:protein indeterminate-domain 14-like [Ananas comosus]|uniref:Protein indeterminate-domain 14-like n=1 Tax=Ananas comosus TaxID=4615 RepID=A0A6P5GPN0_ANACO|nr:protein indeterminate-domain 14-like [Ananas comosus]